MHCAARNRFLTALNPQLPGNNGKSNELWHTVGLELVNYFKQQGAMIDWNFIEPINSFNVQWREQFCDHEEGTRKNLSPEQWIFAQIAQMGIEGLDALFDSLERYKGSVPKLAYTFDLNGSITDNSAEDYTNYLTYKIENFDALFSSLSLIIPSSLTTELQNSLIALIEAIDARQAKFPQEIHELSLFSLQNSTVTSNSLIQALTVLAESKGLRTLIKLPEWDRESYINETQKDYRSLQNKILDNQRVHKNKQLVGQTKNFSLLVNNELKADFIIAENLGQQAQPWDGDNVTYPLGSAALGIQQQLQQKVEQVVGQEVHAEQAVQVVQEFEPTQKIVSYSGNKDNLFTRLTINDRRHPELNF